MANEWSSVTINHSIEVNIPANQLAKELRCASAKETEFEVRRESFYTYSFFEYKKYLSANFILDNRMPITTGSLIPIGPSKSRVAINSNLKVILLFYPFLVILMNMVYFVALANGAHLPLTLKAGIIGFTLLLIALLRLAKVGSRQLHANIIRFLRELEEEYHNQLSQEKPDMVA
ncbi:MAG: hypothetical protein AAGC85_13545 [Bacteroidota bacterium]